VRRHRHSDKGQTDDRSDNGKEPTHANAPQADP
jgi:hypothetical protein